MPQVFKVGSYWVFFWTEEGLPLEPVHVHIAEGRPTKNATKVWVTRAGHCVLCHNGSRIPVRELRILMQTVEARSAEVITKWRDIFGEATFYC